MTRIHRRVAHKDRQAIPSGSLHLRFLWLYFPLINAEVEANPAPPDSKLLIIQILPEAQRCRSRQLLYDRVYSMYSCIGPMQCCVSRRRLAIWRLDRFFLRIRITIACGVFSKNMRSVERSEKYCVKRAPSPT
jgi:hypothetical protein